jgi:tetratricopeptide (TPR) repeat protein
LYNNAISLNNLAGLYKNQENYIEALPLYQEALQIRKEMLGERHPAYAESLHNIGALYFAQEDYKQAKVYLEEAYSIWLEKLGKQHPHTQYVKKMLDNLPRTHTL